MYNQDLTTAYTARKPHPDRVAAILKFAGNSILDVGCGNGAYVLHLMQKYTITGVDYQPFATWQVMPQKFAVADASHLHFKDDSVDTITSFEVLEHLPEPARALQDFYRVCRKNIIITVPNCDITSGMHQSHLIYSHWTDRTHLNFFDFQSISKLVEAAGFNLVKASYINPISPLPMLIEMLGCSGITRKVALKLLSKVQPSRYHMTCLVVANKTN